MTYTDLASKAESFITINSEIYAMLMGIITRCNALGLSATECLELINDVLKTPTEVKVYTLNKETKHRIIDVGFYLELREMVKYLN